MRRDGSIRDFGLGAGTICAMLILTTQVSRGDESGISFWLPGQISSLPAVPQSAPGWSMGTVYYHTSVAASGSVAAAREIQIGRLAPNVNVSLNASLHAQADLLLLNPTYTFGTPVLGGQLAMGVTGIFGRSAATIDGTLTTSVGGFAATRMGSIGDSITSVGDLYPMITLKWNSGVNNYMTYITGDIPVGAYDPSRIANIGNRSRRHRCWRRLHVLEPGYGCDAFRRCGIHLQFQEPRHAGSKRNRFPFRLEHSAISFETGFRGPGRLRLSASLR
ncbi:hypothetical protein ACVWW4_007059 [Bradyrhizobium sp. LB7.1]